MTAPATATNSELPRLVKALRGERVDRTPLWFMRQAGRFLPEYRELRAKHSMLELITTPELAAEVTLQPLRRFDFDGAIIFADILNPLIGLGVELTFEKGVGPVIRNPLDSMAAVKALANPDLEENSGYTLDAIRIVRNELLPRNVPVLGFAGAPFTLSAYMIEGGGSKNYEKAKAFMYQQPEAWALLQEKLVDLVSEYLIAQINAGVSAVQLFDSWLGILGPEDYRTYVAPYLEAIIKRVKQHSDTPFIFFATGIAALYSEIGKLPADVFGVDWRVSLLDAEAMLGRRVPLQGNIDPVKLATASKEVLRQEVLRILEEGQQLTGHICNVGHGIIPSTPIENVEFVLDIVQEFR